MTGSPGAPDGTMPGNTGPGNTGPGNTGPGNTGPGIGPGDTGLKLDVDGAVATVTLHRPERRNAMTPSMWRGLAKIGNSLPPQVRAVVVRGDGPSFSAGIDLRLFSADLDTAVAGLVAALLAPDPATVRAVKKLLSGAPARTLEEQAAAERTAQAALQRERRSGGST